MWTAVSPTSHSFDLPTILLFPIRLIYLFHHGGNRCNRNTRGYCSSVLTKLPLHNDADTARLISYRSRLPFPVRTEGSTPIIIGPKEATLKKYNGMLNQIARFSLLVGCDQTSLLLFLDLCPDMPGPIVASTFCLFLSYKICDKGEFVMDHLTGNSVINCRTNKPIRAEGGWSCPSNLEGVCSAVKHIHNLYPDLLGDKHPYIRSCSQCVTIYLNNPATSPPCPCQMCALVHYVRKLV